MYFLYVLLGRIYNYPNHGYSWCFQLRDTINNNLGDRIEYASIQIDSVIGFTKVGVSPNTYN